MQNLDLTLKEDTFAKYVAEGKLYYEAYKLAYNAEKMGINTIYVKSSLLMSKDKIRIRVEEYRKQIKAQEKLTLDEIIVRLSRRNEVDIKGYVNPDGTFKKIDELTDDQAVFISGFKVSEIWGRGENSGTQIGRVVDIKIESFKDIMDMLIRHYGGYAKDKEPVNSNLDLIKELLDKIKH